MRAACYSGTRVLFGFQFNGIFQHQFESLPFLSRVFVCAGLTLLTLAIALLIAPSMEHRIVERGQDSRRVLALATLFAGQPCCRSRSPWRSTSSRPWSAS